jgi:hypothetical protein
MGQGVHLLLNICAIYLTTCVLATKYTPQILKCSPSGCEVMALRIGAGGDNGSRCSGCPRVLNHM